MLKETKMCEDLEQLPHWAIAKNDGKLVLGAMLPTRDGRLHGNAHIIEITADPYRTGKQLYVVLTDAGKTIRFNEGEIKNSFYKSEWISDVQEVIRKFSPR